MDSEPAFRTLPARYYIDPEVFRDEMERLYFNSWVCVGRSDVIPNAGDYFLQDIVGKASSLFATTPAPFTAFITCAATAALACAPRRTAISTDESSARTTVGPTD